MEIKKLRESILICVSKICCAKHLLNVSSALRKTFEVVVEHQLLFYYLIKYSKKIRLVSSSK